MPSRRLPADQWKDGPPGDDGSRSVDLLTDCTRHRSIEEVSLAGQVADSGSWRWGKRRCSAAAGRYHGAWHTRVWLASLQAIERKVFLTRGVLGPSQPLP
jgi:hypothetical protein